MHIRQARPEDLPAIAALEARGFPPAEAASPESFAARFAVFPHCFFVAEDDGAIVGHINGCMTDFDTCRDELYHDAGLHREEAPHQAVFGLVVDPQRQHQGIGAALVRHFLEVARQRGKEDVVLTCKERLIPFYSSLGFRLLGRSDRPAGMTCAARCNAPEVPPPPYSPARKTLRAERILLTVGDSIVTLRNTQ